MLDRSEDKSLSAEDHAPDLDAAIEQCVLELEKSVQPDINALIERFPKWKDEIVEFLENWGGMERFAAMVGDREPVDPDQLPEDERRFGDYELIEKIGIGGMGVIYKARQISLDRIVALKMILRDRHDRERFRMEAESAASLSHPNIVSIYEIGEHEKGRLFFTMQLIEGCDLKEYLQQHKISSIEAAKITETVARAVHYAHQRGILHRDLKPANVLMDANGQPHITDFGLAKPIERDTELTRTGMIMGTPGYMSPEQASGKIKNLTIATDVYGLGAILYSLLTGHAPFTGDSSLEVLRRVVDEPPASPRSRNPGIERDIETVCMKCLEKSPDRRYASPQLLADDLARFLNHQPVKARPVSTTERAWRWCRRNPAIATLTAAVALLLVATSITALSLAVTERNLRLTTEENNRRELGLVSALNQALDRANEERGNLLMTNGLWQASSQNVGEALLWFTEAAQLAPKDPEKIRSSLINFQSWLREHPMPIAAVDLGQEYFGDEHIDDISFHPHGSAIMNRVGRKVIIWDYTRSHIWHLKKTFPNMSTALWSPDGKGVIVGLDDGRIIQADIKTHQTKTLLQIDDGVFELALVNHNKWLAISSGSRVLFADLEKGELVGNEISRNRAVRKLIPNSSGTRLVVINYAGKDTSMYSIGEVETKELFQFDCFYKSLQDRKHLLWPRFVKNEEVLLARVAFGKTVTMDPDTGDYLGEIQLERPTYSLAVATDGESLVSGCFNFAQHYRFSRLYTKAEVEKYDSLDRQLDCEPNVRFEHDNVVVSTAIGCNGMVATAGWNNQVKLWRTQSLSFQNKNFDVPEKAVPLAVLPHQSQVRCVAFSPGCATLLTIQVDGLVRLWRIPTVETHGYDVAVEAGGSLAKLVDENRWITAGMSKWTGHMADPIVHQIHDGSFDSGIQGLSTSKEGHLLDSAVSVDKKQLATIHAGFGRSGNTFRKGIGKSGWLRIWDLDSGELLHEPIPLPAEPRWVTYHPHENYLAICTCLMQIIFVDAATFQIKDSWETWADAKTKLTSDSLLPLNSVNEQIAFSPDGKSLIAWSSRRPGLWVWDVVSGSPRFPMIRNSGLPIGGFSFSPDGTKIAIAGGHNPIVRVLDLQSGKWVCEDLTHASEVHSVEFSPDGDSLITACRDGHARVFNWRTGELLLKEMRHNGAVVDAAFTPDSKFLTTLGRDSQLRVWNANDGSLALRPFAVPAGAADLVISPDSRYVIVAGGQIRVADLGELQNEPDFDLETARQISEILANKTISEGSLVTLSTDEWQEKWLNYSSKK